ncbi:hypothetical protein B7P43_G08265 [Cryptotermes secundus]|uniref:Uncharacterized protein n=1 Tax=Cryptotermes secundus TaxID=105785 RepID=A0A2J7RH61_9NEOP|nr:hypothetical protein B7P43_G08265 [Cryptotermes secundus]
MFLQDVVDFNGIHVLTSRDSAIGVATGYGLDDRVVGVRVPIELRIFPGREADHSPPASAEVKNV